MNNIIENKSFNFAIRIIKLYKYLTDSKNEYVLSKQLLRSGTSIGANVAEAEQAQSKPDFVSKLQIALKECSETEYWLELLIESGYYNDHTILDRCIEVKKILIASINTVKASQEIEN